jgi:hypothetical protein
MNCLLQHADASLVLLGYTTKGIGSGQDQSLPALSKLNLHYSLAQLMHNSMIENQ